MFILQKYPHLVLYPVCPTTSARFRQALYPSGSKSDPSDTDLLLQLVLHPGTGRNRHRSHLRRLDPDTPETRLLQMLVEQRRKLVDDRTRYSNQLTAGLKLYFPQVLKWIDNIDSPLGCDLLEKWPSLQEIKRAHPGTLRKFFVEHNCRSAERIKERIDAIYQAKPAVEDKALLQGGAAITLALVVILQALNTCIAQLDEQIAEAESAHPESVLFAGLPGAGPALRPRLIVAFGTLRERYSSAAQLQSYSGIAPVSRAGAPSGFTSGGPAQNFYDKRSTNSPGSRSRVQPGRGLITICRKAGKRDIMPPCEPWPGNGFGCCSGAGKIASPTTNRLICGAGETSFSSVRASGIRHPRGVEDGGRLSETFFRKLLTD